MPVAVRSVVLTGSSMRRPPPEATWKRLPVRPVQAGMTGLPERYSGEICQRTST
jgi:hypothetical protein